jgi:primosomal protein N'
MTTIDCPFCSGPLTIDDAFVTAMCDACGVTSEIAADPVINLELEPAA